MIDFYMNYATAIIDTVVKLVAVCGGVSICVGVWQYRHSVKIAKMNERRASVELAARECAHYGAVLMKEFTNLRQNLEKSGCEYLKHYKIVEEGEQLKFDASTVTAEDRKKIEPHLPEIICVLNKLEGFAIPFATGVADDDVGFMECGRSFVTIVENNLGLYSFTNLNHYYLSSQTIYGRWKKRINGQEIERHHMESGKKFFILTAERLENENPKSRTALFLAKILRKAADIISNSRS